MKLTLEQITEGLEEIIIRYRERTESLDNLIRSIQQRGEKILAVNKSGKILLAPSEVLYLECVGKR